MNDPRPIHPPAPGTRLHIYPWACPPSAGRALLESYGSGTVVLTVTGVGGGDLDYITARIDGSDDDERIIWDDIRRGIATVERHS